MARYTPEIFSDGWYGFQRTEGYSENPVLHVERLPVRQHIHSRSGLTRLSVPGYIAVIHDGIGHVTKYTTTTYPTVELQADDPLQQDLAEKKHESERIALLKSLQLKGFTATTTSHNGMRATSIALQRDVIRVTNEGDMFWDKELTGEIEEAKESRFFQVSSQRPYFDYIFELPVDSYTTTSGQKGIIRSGVRFRPDYDIPHKQVMRHIQDVWREKKTIEGLFIRYLTAEPYVRIAWEDDISHLSW